MFGLVKCDWKLRAQLPGYFLKREILALRFPLGLGCGGETASSIWKRAMFYGLVELQDVKNPSARITSWCRATLVCPPPSGLLGERDINLDLLELLCHSSLPFSFPNIIQL